MLTSTQSRRWLYLPIWLIFHVSAAPVNAVNWDGGGSTSEWLEAANWQFNMIPTASETATILNDTATITGVFVPPVQQLEVGLNLAPGILVINGAGNSATLEVLSTAAIGSRGELELGAPTANLFANQLFNQGEVRVSTGGKIRSFQQYLQQDGATSLFGGQIEALTLQFNDGLLEGNGLIIGNVSLGGVPPKATPTISPGNGIGDLAINGDLELRSNAQFFVEIDASRPTIVSDLVNVSGMVSLGGTLHLDLIAGSIAAGDRVEILLADDFEPGTYFDDITGLETDNGGLIVVFDPVGDRFASPSISIYETTEPGDMNGDGDVDTLDAELFAWAIRDANSYESQFVDSLVDVDCNLAVVCKAAPFFMADMDGDRRRTFADIPTFLEKVDMSGGNPAAALLQIANVLNEAQVPEPATAWLAVIALWVHVQSIRQTNH